MQTDDTALLVNTPTQAESLLHSLEKTAGGIGLHINVDKTECMCFNQNQTRDISTLIGSSLKIADKFTYLRNSVSSTENDINTRLAKAWTAIIRQSYPIKQNTIFSKQQSGLYYYMNAPHRRWQNTWRKSLTAIAQECYEPYWKNPGRNIPQNSSCMLTYLPPLKPFKSDEQDMQNNAGKVRMSSEVMFSSGLLHTNK